MLLLARRRSSISEVPQQIAMAHTLELPPRKSEHTGFCVEQFEKPLKVSRAC